MQARLLDPRPRFFSIFKNRLNEKHEFKEKNTNHWWF